MDATILIVDDEAANLHVLSELLHPRYRVLAARSGETALAAAASTPPPDLILLDIVMPGMDGLAVLERLRAGAATRDIPVIFVSALDSAQDELRGLELGAVDFLHKPVNPAIALARIRTQLELKRARDRLAAAIAAKSDFLAMVSHELRTPLHGIMGSAELLQFDACDDEVRESANVILGSAQHLLDMVNQLLEAAKLEAGRAQPAIAAVAVRPLLEQAFAAQKSAAARKGLAFDFDCALDGELRVLCDPTALRRVLHNLLDNAIKFTAAGGIVLRAQRAAGVQIEVRDSGPGIAAADLPQLFQKFVQLEHFGTRTAPGSGLGLALSRELVQQMGGTLDVRSTPGRGTTFWFSLPLAA